MCGGEVLLEGVRCILNQNPLMGILLWYDWRRVLELVQVLFDIYRNEDV